jgi:hypothetical protein
MLINILSKNKNKTQYVHTRLNEAILHDNNTHIGNKNVVNNIKTIDKPSTPITILLFSKPNQVISSINWKP